jgi:hypothetical protein
MVGNTRVLGNAGWWPLGAILAAALLGLSGLTLGPAAASTADSTPPNTAVLEPLGGERVAASSPLEIMGTATDGGGVAAVRVAVQNTATGLWWHSDGTWGSATWQLAPLASPGASTTTWTASWPAPASGGFRVQATAVDSSDNVDATPSVVGFTIRSGTWGGFLTIVMGRTQWVTTGNCRPLPGAVPLDQVAAAMANLGVPATGTVVVDRIQTTGQLCDGGAWTYPNWSQLAALRDQYGWSMVSDGFAHKDMTKLTLAQQRTESCGTLPVFAAHGFDRAWGMFAYGNNQYTSTIQANVVSLCFGYGRTYQPALNVRSQTRSPWLQKTRSWTGGACNDSSLPCYTIPVPGSTAHYLSPNSLASQMFVKPDEWRAVQMYRFVTGSYSGAISWDCTGSDWRTHWTSRHENYCLNDFLAALGQIPSGVTVTDPAGVAQAWYGDTIAPTTTISSGPAASTTATIATFQFSSSELRSYALCSLDGGTQQLCYSGLSYSNLASGGHTFSVRSIDATGGNQGPAATWNWTVG